MLHLLNGDSLTEQDKQAFKNNNTRAYLLNNNYELSQNNHIQSVDFKDERYNEEKGNFIGEAICKSIDVKLVNQDNDLDLENEDLEYRVGAKVGNTYKYISFGNFIVQKPENEEVNEQTSFQALDYMCKFNIPYEQRLTLPMTVGALVADVCDQAGVTLGTSTFRNSDKLIANNPFINGEQCREVIKSVAKISFSVAYINQENELCFGFNLKTTADEEITTDEYFELEPNKETKPISVIVLRSGEIPSNGRRIVDNALIQEYGENELIIEEDYLSYTDDLRDEFLVAARSLMGLVYKPISIDLLGSIYLDFNDVLQITNLKDEVIKTYCLNNIHTYNGTLYNSISSPAVTESEEQYKYQDENKSKSKKTFANIDKANQRIDLVVEDVEEQASTISDLSVSVGEIQAEIESIADPIGEITTAVSSITITDAVEGDLYELRIKGNNELFGGLYPSNTLTPSNSVYPESPVSILRVNHRANEEEEYEEDVYDLGVKSKGILRQIVIGGKEYYDEYVLSPEYNYDPKIIRRVKSDGSGILDNEVIEDVTEETGGIHVKLYSGEENIITLDKFLATIFVRYIRKTEFGEIYATNISVDSKIQVAKDEIDLEVNQKVDKDEIIAKINLAVEDQQGIIEITGNQISIESDTFELTPDGKITATAGEISGFEMIRRALNTGGNIENWSILQKIYGSGSNYYMNGLMVPDNTYGLTYIVAGMPTDEDGNNWNTANANLRILSDGTTYVKRINMNGESGYTRINFDSGREAMSLTATQLSFRLDNNDNALFARFERQTNGFYLFLQDAPRFYIWDNLHGRASYGVDLNNGSRQQHYFRGQMWKNYADDGVTYYAVVDESSSSSDRRLKHNIEDSKTNALAIIDAIKFRQFDWNEESPYPNTHIDIGVIAQEVMEIDENYVVKGERVIDDKVQEMYSMNELNLITTAMKAIQELNEKVKEQQNIIDKQDKLIKDLIERIEKLEKRE